MLYIDFNKKLFARRKKLRRFLELIWISTMPMNGAHGSNSSGNRQPKAAKGAMKDVLATRHLSGEEYEKAKPFIKGVQQPKKPLKPTAHFVADFL